MRSHSTLGKYKLASYKSECLCKDDLLLLHRRYGTFVSKKSYVGGHLMLSRIGEIKVELSNRSSLTLG